MELTEFLLARIDEDEAVAREVQERCRVVSNDHGIPMQNYYEDAKGSTASIYWDVDYAQGGYTITAARVLAECEAKRRIVALAEIQSDPVATVKFARKNPKARPWRYVLLSLALPYADHDEYRSEWAL